MITTQQKKKENNNLMTALLLTQTTRNKFIQWMKRQEIKETHENLPDLDEKEI
jgi:hypothetical protein